jgi:branched-subunit amino acid aminotransferase/4-amino-4-deoxychorismate lyase
VQVLVAGDPRPAAQAKHADWVVARQPLQQLQQQAGVDEVVLSDSSGALLEGLVSSFFVVADAAQMAALGQPLTAASVYPGGGSGQDNATQQQQHKQQEGSKQLTGLVLMTTGPAADALLGITQQRVVQACQQLKLPVVLQPAKSCTAGAWREAFLSSW